MARIYNLPCLLMIAVFTIVTAEDYCKLQSCEKKELHTMCKYSSSYPAAACGQSYSTDLNDVQRKAILDEHNQIRRKVASGQECRGNPGPQYAAVTMPDLTWDDELETIAQRWANQCNFKHDQCRNVERFKVGQNIGQTSSSGENSSSLKSIIEKWCNEVAKFPQNKTSSYEFDSQTDHYTQMVWASTTKIGCGYIEYKDPNKWNTKYLVCNYGPSGNMIGEKVYEVYEAKYEVHECP